MLKKHHRQSAHQGVAQGIVKIRPLLRQLLELLAAGLDRGFQRQIVKGSHGGKLPKNSALVTTNTNIHGDLTSSEHLTHHSTSKRKNSFPLQPDFSALSASPRIAGKVWAMRCIEFSFDKRRH